MKKSFIFLISLFFFITGLSLRAQNKAILPVPQNLQWGKEKFQLSGAKIFVSADLFSREQKAIDQFIDYVQGNTGSKLAIIYSEDPSVKMITLKSNSEGSVLPMPGDKAGKESREAYNIDVKSNKIEVSANSDAGLFYALQTLQQLVTPEEKNSYIPEVSIEDYPQFAYRGVMMDFSHGGLLTEAEIKNQIDLLAKWRNNQYYFYNEVSIEMKGYPLINYNACYSREQIKRIVAYSREKHMDVIPFVNFYGHLHELLRLEKYTSLGIGKYGHDLDPSNPGVQTLLKDWIKQYTEIFPTPFIHVGFDETWETERLTIERPEIKPKELYLKQINFVAKTLQSYGKTVMLWTDITKNHPDIMSEFPKDVIPVIWEYSPSPTAFPQWLKPVQKEKLPFFVQSAVDNWGNVYSGAYVSYGNIEACLKVCRDEKALGYITSIWTDAVQPQLRNTWLYMAYGAAGAWQKDKMDRKEFLDSYCRMMYPGISESMKQGFSKMEESEAYLAKCVGGHTILEMFGDPFSAHFLKNTATHYADFKNSRAAAESAFEYFSDALNAKTKDSSFIKSMLHNARMEHYASSRFIWAKTIVDRWNWPYDSIMQGKKDYIMYYDVNYSTHGLTVDMMDWCTELKEEYRQAWLAEYMPYRLGTMLGRFDTEYALWRDIYNKIQFYRFHHDAKLPRGKFEDLFLDNKKIDG
jgi:hypothetical protein